ncbi:hypothetical protein Ga0466249_005045 [Sporomusaceae bacterium BoRhaA]|uniref:hypothetical protein n=1 Tax=Pelorhabdus rhamnosifermentans TaxID=2772457 RepID=UPI001C05FF2C|nr:hypothetical protein [Pelorhabdus rhamnosifermentans]MBU2703895.1 hypothetical protein [Pelorhabdus rhamnosifermentans]
MTIKRSRDNNGQIRKKRGDTEQGTLEKEYGNKIPPSRSDKQLKNILKDNGADSLSELLKKRE